MHSPQKDKGTRDWKYRALATLSICWCFLFTTKFCWGQLKHEKWWMTPCLKNLENFSWGALSLELISWVPPSSLNAHLGSPIGPFEPSLLGYTKMLNLPHGFHWALSKLSYALSWVLLSSLSPRLLWASLSFSWVPLSSLTHSMRWCFINK